MASCKEFEILTEDISRMCRETWITGWKVIARDRFKIIGYRPESKTIFLFIPDSVYSYQATERELNFVGSQYFRRFHTSCKIVSYLHCLAPIQTGMAVAQEKKDTDHIWREMEQGGTAISDDLK